MKMFSFVVPDKPHPCQRANPVRGRMVDTHKNRKAKKFIAKCINERVEEMGGFEPFSGGVKIFCRYYFEKPRTSKLDQPTHLTDIDNLLKTTMDGITRANGLKGENGDVIWHDDGCVLEVEAEKKWCDGDEQTGTFVMIQEVV